MMAKPGRWFWLCLAVLIYGLGWLMMPLYWFPFDMEVWHIWANTVDRVGLSHAYVTTGVADAINYNPVWVYCLRCFTWLVDAGQRNEHIWCIKSITWSMECAMLILLAKTAWENNLRKWPVYVLLVSPVMWYNALVWGQIDGLYCGFLLLMVYALAGRYFHLAVLFFVLALLTKPQAIVALPIAGLVLLPEYRKKPVLLGGHVLMAIAVGFIVCAPFIWAGFGDRLLNMNNSVTTYYAHVSKNAYNVWELLVGGDLYHLPDSESFWGATFHQWGLVFFMTASGIALWPALRWMSFWNQARWLDRLQAIFLLTAAVYLGFFLFNTQMHERYLHPAVWALAGYACSGGPWRPLAVVGILYWLNLESVLQATSWISHSMLPVIKPLVAAFLLLEWGSLIRAIYGLIKPIPFTTV